MTRVVLLAAALSAQVLGQSAWMPRPGRVTATGVFTTQSFRDIWAGKRRVTLPGRVAQHTGAAAVEIGLTRRLAADVAFGGSGVRTTAFGGRRRSDSGVMDSTFGLRVAAVEERGSSLRGRPALAIRVGGIIRGSYQPAFPFSAGDGASGVEVSVLAGKSLRESAGAYAEAGYRHRNRLVPPDQFAAVGAYKRIRGMTVSAGYRGVRGLGGPDIGDPGFTFPRLREVNHLIEPSIGFSHYQVFAAKSVGGRNTGDTIVVGVAVSFGFKAPWSRKSG